MQLHRGLLDQAKFMATRDARGRPRQGNLRRAVSATYYALFHFLVDEAPRFLIGAAPDRAALRSILARAFEHGAMKRASNPFAKSSLPKKFVPALGNSRVPSNLAKIAESFRTLQERRHEADYDRLRQFERDEVIAFIGQAEKAMHLWPSVRDTPAGRLYLVALLAGERIRE